MENIKKYVFFRPPTNIVLISVTFQGNAAPIPMYRPAVKFRMIDKDLLHRLQDLNTTHTNNENESQSDDESTDDDGDDDEDCTGVLNQASTSTLVENLFVDPLIDLGSITLRDILSDEPLISLNNSEVVSGRNGVSDVPEEGAREANWDW